MNDQTEYLHFGILYQIFFYPVTSYRKKHPIPHTLYPTPFYTLGAAASTSGFT
ncbi:MAG: hypothetical protein ACK5CH_03845 [Bacteroidota bacterium]|jgi:hypothetical protein